MRVILFSFCFISRSYNQKEFDVKNNNLGYIGLFGAEAVGYEKITVQIAALSERGKKSHKKDLIMYLKLQDGAENHKRNGEWLMSRSGWSKTEEEGET